LKLIQILHFSQGVFAVYRFNYISSRYSFLSFSSARPDLVRLGDLNLYSSQDDNYAQQLEIDDVIRHPDYKISSAYDDIALLRLKGSAK
jgi:transmembrane protease serine 9